MLARSALAIRRNERLALIPADTIAAPTLTGATPTEGVESGDSVVLTGTTLTTAKQVYFGATAATSFTVDSATQITAIAPGTLIATTSVVVNTLGGQATLSVAFTAAQTFTGQLGTSRSSLVNIELGVP